MLCKPPHLLGAIQMPVYALDNAQWPPSFREDGIRKGVVSMIICPFVFTLP